MHPTVQVELIKQTAEVLKALVWPALALMLVLRFRAGFGDFFRRMSEFNLKTPAGEFSAKAAAEVGALLGAAHTAKRIKQEPDTAESESAVHAVSRSVEAVVRASPRVRYKSILWVDDHPENNRYEVQAFEALGVRVDTAASTEEALRKLQGGRHDLVITDLTRGEDPSAGLSFIRSARRSDPGVRIIVYSGPQGAEQFGEAYALGVVGATFEPNELFDRAMSFLGA